MQEVLLECTPLPLDVIANFIMPMTDQLNHREKYEKAMQGIRDYRKKRFWVLDRSVWPKMRGIRAHSIYTDYPWYSLSYDKLQECMNAEFRPNLQQAYRKRVLNKLIAWTKKRMANALPP